MVFNVISKNIYLQKFPAIRYAMDTDPVLFSAKEDIRGMWNYDSNHQTSVAIII